MNSTQKSRLNRPLIIEFNGIPGCGKTTICNALGNKLSEEGYSVSCYSDYFKKIAHNRRMQIILVFKYFHAFIEWLELLVKMTREITKDRVTVKYMISSAIQFCGKLRYYDMCETKYILSDQGLVQEILSIFHTQTDVLHAERLFYLIKKYFDPIVLVDVDIDVETSCRRVNSRVGGTSRIDGLCDTQEQLRIQRIECEVLNRIRESNEIIDAIKISSADGSQLDMSVNKIMTYIKKRKNS